MPYLVTVGRDGTADLDAAVLNHDGHDYPGPVFDVPPDVAAELTSRAAFRHATAAELEQTQTVKPRRPRKPATD